MGDVPFSVVTFIAFIIPKYLFSITDYFPENDMICTY